ncbi:arylamine N-acetyltransferase [Nonomuraea dietziae]|uniref:arylamine N-acetyltransferase n=1 Tax=Nonomuraea dietziae TaxID=65515 RepID=UPI0031D8BFB2
MDISAYLRRLGLEAAPPSLDQLKALHVAHIERVPYEALEIWLDRPTTVDPADVRRADRPRARGVYCYHLNGAFSLLLEALGYQVTPGMSGARATCVACTEPQANLSQPPGFLTVPPARRRLMVDLGLGDALHERSPLRRGTLRQGALRVRLRPLAPVAPAGWTLRPRPRRLLRRHGLRAWSRRRCRASRSRCTGT